ncbi:MAG: hypothetical protein P8099_01870 [Gemmatimonadota bacterium]|jgi:hypothetical protein
MLPTPTRRLLGLAGVVCYLCFVSAYLPGAHHCIEDGLVVQYLPASTHHPSQDPDGHDHDDDACHCVGPCTADVVALLPAGTPPVPVHDAPPSPAGLAAPRLALPRTRTPHLQPPANAPPRLG